MDIAKRIRLEKEDIVGRYGPWTAHNIQLHQDIYTIDNRITGDEIKLRRVIQIISDISPEPIGNLRVLDLACLEGLYSIELALHGARVVAIEGREANIEKARFVKKVLSLENLEIYQDDVRNLCREKHGGFDVVLCLGILYHLDAPDIFVFVERASEVCERFAIIDTHISTVASASYPYNNRVYHGSFYQEHSSESTVTERLRALWASLDNERSFWPTKVSLYNLLSHAGFTSVYECHNPPETGKPDDRVTLLAIKGKKTRLLSSHIAATLVGEDWPEK